MKYFTTYQLHCYPVQTCITNVGRLVSQLVGRERWKLRKITAIEIAMLCIFGYFLFHDGQEVSSLGPTCMLQRLKAPKACESCV